jgi:hypothetical protein
MDGIYHRHCEERSDSNPESCQGDSLDCFALLAMTVGHYAYPTLGVIARLDRAIQ